MTCLHIYNLHANVVSTVPVYIAVGKEVQRGLNRSRGGDSTKHQMRKLQQDAEGTETEVL